MVVKTAAQAMIDRLNARAAELSNGAEGHPAYLACLDAARELGFADVAPEVSPASDTMALANAQGEHVNLWVNGQQSQRVEVGGIGFDTNLDWYEEYQAEGTGNADLGEAVSGKLGLTAAQFNALYTNVPVDGWTGAEVEADLRRRFGLEQDEPIGQALHAQGVLTEEEAEYVDEPA